MLAAWCLLRGALWRGPPWQHLIRTGSAEAFWTYDNSPDFAMKARCINSLNRLWIPCWGLWNAGSRPSPGYAIDKPDVPLFQPCIRLSSLWTRIIPGIKPCNPGVSAHWVDVSGFAGGIAHPVVTQYRTGRTRIQGQVDSKQNTGRRIQNWAEQTENLVVDVVRAQQKAPRIAFIAKKLCRSMFVKQSAVANV